jgi:hypothetical protein
MSITDTAKHFGVHRRTIENWIKKGCPFTVKGLRGYVLDPVAVRAWVEEQRNV